MAVIITEIYNNNDDNNDYDDTKKRVRGSRII